jgi:hypothetical protein
MMFLSGTGPITGHLQVHAGDAVDDIRSFGWDVDFCGYTIAPLVTNSFVVQVFGHGGNDRLENYVWNVSIGGGPNNDVLSQWQGNAGGGPDADVLYGDNGSQLLGGRGDDRFEVMTGRAELVDGGEDYDELCGATVELVWVEDDNACP